MIIAYLGPKHFDIQPSCRRTSEGYYYDVYEPFQPLGKTILMVYGFTIAGEKESRLVRFAQCFAAAGFRVGVPVLPGLKSINLQKGDLDILTNVMNAMVKEAGIPMSIVGFCVGGGLALVAATDMRFREHIDPILLIGPPYSFTEVWAELWHRDIQSPDTDREWDDFIWQQLILAYRNHETLSLSTTELNDITHLLQVYCFESSLAIKLDAYERLLKPHGFLDPLDVPIDLGELERLSPCDKLRNLTSQVLIIHDPQDLMIPHTQSMKIFAELEQRNLPDRQRLLISPMFSHVSFRAVVDLSDLATLLDMFGELFST